MPISGGRLRLMVRFPSFAICLLCFLLLGKRMETAWLPRECYPAVFRLIFFVLVSSYPIHVVLFLLGFWDHSPHLLEVSVFAESSALYFRGHMSGCPFSNQNFCKSNVFVFSGYIHLQFTCNTRSSLFCRVISVRSRTGFWPSYVFGILFPIHMQLPVAGNRVVPWCDNRNFLVDLGLWVFWWR